MLNSTEQVIIFDLDGPILDGSRKHHECYSDILRLLNCEPLPLSQYWELKRRMIPRDEVLALSGAEKHYERFVEDWHQLIETEKYLRFDVVQPHVHEVLNVLRKSSHRLLLVTMRNNPQTLTTQLSNLNLDEYFETIQAVSSKKGRDSKVEAIERILERTSAAECLWVGDTEADIVPAKSLGIACCAITSGIRERCLLEALAPNYLIDSLSELLSVIEHAHTRDR